MVLEIVFAMAMVILEVKFCFKYRDLDISEICIQDSTFYLDKDTQLKRSHKYHTQIQFQMYVCQLLFCDFVAFTLRGIYIQTRDYDPEFVSSLTDKCSSFAFDYLIPEILCHKLEDKEIVMYVKTVCRRPRFGKIQSCSNISCRIKHHLSCIGHQRKYKGQWKCKECQRHENRVMYSSRQKQASRIMNGHLSLFLFRNLCFGYMYMYLLELPHQGFLTSTHNASLYKGLCNLGHLLSLLFAL